MNWWKKITNSIGILALGWLMTTQVCFAQISSNTNVSVEIQFLPAAIAANSTIEAIPPTETVGGLIELRVTVRGFGNTPLAGELVQLTMTGPAGAILTQPAVPTNAAGQTSGWITSPIAGTWTINATIVTDPLNPILINDTATPTFTPVFVPPPPNETPPIPPNPGTVYSPLIFRSYCHDDGNGQVIISNPNNSKDFFVYWRQNDSDPWQQILVEPVTNYYVNVTWPAPVFFQYELNGSMTDYTLTQFDIRCTPADNLLDIYSDCHQDSIGSVIVENYNDKNILLRWRPLGQNGWHSLIINRMTNVRISVPWPDVIEFEYDINQQTQNLTINQSSQLCNLPPPPPPEIIPPEEIVEETRVLNLVGWTFPNSNVSINLSPFNIADFADLDGVFAASFTFDTIQQLEAYLDSYYARLGIYPRDIMISIDDATLRRGQTVYVLMPPSIKISNEVIFEDEILEFRGTSAPNVDLEVYVFNKEGDYRIYFTKSDSIGFWQISDENNLSPGDYQVYSVARNNLGFISQPSYYLGLTVLPKAGPFFLPAFYELLLMRLMPYLNVLKALTFWLALALLLYSLLGLIYDIINMILLGLNQLVGYLGYVPKRKAWGIVYNADTKKPIDLAVVRLYDAVTKKQIESRVTDKYGRYGFLVKKGDYEIEVTKNGFRFPAEGVFGKYDGRYTNLYFGERIRIESDDQQINYNIPLSPNETIKRSIWLESKYYFKRIQYILGKFSLPLLSLGFIVSVAIVLIESFWLNYLVSLIYLVALIYKFYQYSIAYKPWGVVYDSVTGNPLGMAVVKIIDPEFDRILETSLTDFSGRYTFLPEAGNYKISVERENYNFPSASCQYFRKKIKIDWYCGQPFEIKKDQEAYINIDIPLDKIIPKKKDDK